MSGKATLFRFKFLSSCLKFFLLSFIVLLFLGQSVELPAQVIIKERVSIYPNSVPGTTLEGVISGDPHNPVYLIYGGEVKVFLRHPGSQSALWYTTRLWEENLGLVAANKSQYDTVALGQFHQWEKFTFWITELNDPEIKYYPHRVLSDEIIYPNYWPSLTNSIWFFIPPIPDDSISNYPLRVWEIDVTRNDNYAAMAPPEILDYFGNPYDPSEEIIIPADGTVYMTVEDVNSNVLIDLYQDMPDNQLLLSDLGSHEGETLNFGRKSAGDRMRFYIQSGHTVVNGMNLYPKTYDDEFYSYFDGSILFKDLYFEDWTDLLFDNLNCSVYLIPDHYADFPWSLDVELSPSVISPGDTAQVILKWRNPDGSLENFPDSLIFDVEIMSGYEYGNLFSPDIPFNFDWYYGLTQGFSFVAVDTIDVDSVWVSIWVGKSGGIISGVSQGKPTAMVAQRSDQVRIKKFNDNKKPAVNGQTILKLGNTDNTAGMGYTIEDVEYPPFFMGIGEVLITEEKPLEIMLGETKYFQAKIDPSDTTKLLIEERESPTLTSDGINEDVWGNEPLEIITGDTTYGKRLGVYWETEKPQMITLNNKVTLPKGMIRIIGRYWHDDSCYYAKLIAKKGNKEGALKIAVVKPAKLGNTYQLSKDVFDKEYNLDSLVIKYAGKYGISPQIIKGQIQKEAPTENFGTYTGFAPAYRYEPFTEDIRLQNIVEINNNLGPNNPFRVTEDNMGTGDLVPDHQHTKYIPYAKTPQTIWDMVVAYSDLGGDCPKTQRIYGRKEPDGKMNFVFYGYKTIQAEYDRILGFFQETKENPSSQDITAAYDSITVYLREIWNGGLDSLIAQTRIASSYGLQQMMYGTALERGYILDNHHCPENLNINIIFYPLAMLHQRNLLKKILGENIIDGHNWPNGYDDAFYKMLDRWNHYMANYEQDVTNNSFNYLPQK